MAELLIYAPGERQQSVQLNSARITLGRSTAADIYFADEGLSRLHLAFERSGEAFLVRDLNSKNGTLVNGKRVSGARALKPNDRIACGHLLIVFQPETRASGVVFVDDPSTNSDNASIVTSLAGVLDQSRKATGPAAHLAALIKAGNELAGDRPLADLFNLILDLAAGAVAASRGVLMIMENGSLQSRAIRGDRFQISTAVRDRVLDAELSVLVRDTSLDEAFRARQSLISANVRTLMAAPLQAQGRVIGLIYVDSPSDRREFTLDDLNLLTVMANVAAIRIEHARLAESEHARKLIERELQQAEAIQRRALPAAPPVVAGLDMAGHNQASRTVGGDYYEFFHDPQGHAAVILADVSGKGLPAALLMMALQARVQPLFESLPTAPGALAEAMRTLNRLTTANCPEGKFVTAFACVIDGSAGVVDWACAGHNPPILVRADGSYELLQEGGPVLGVFADLAFPQGRSVLRSGDILLIYSDGISEACSPSDDDFDIPEIAAVLQSHRGRPASEIVAAVLAAVAQWTCNAPPADDMTCVAVKKL